MVAMTTAAEALKSVALLVCTKSKYPHTRVEDSDELVADAIRELLSTIPADKAAILMLHHMPAEYIRCLVGAREKANVWGLVETYLHCGWKQNELKQWYYPHRKSGNG